MPEYTYAVKVFISLIMLAVILFVCQKAYKKILTRTQYDYARDISLLIGFFASVLWLGNGMSRFVVAAAFLSLMVGFVQKRFPEMNLRYLFLPIGLLFALWGPSITFIGMPEDQYFYLSSWASAIITTLWIAFFPVLVQELDHIPGMSGHLLALTFSLSVLVTLFSGQSLGAAFLVSLSGLMLLAVFWSRHGHMYRQLGKPLAAFWGTILAGTSLLGVSKGITFSTLMIVPLGLFAIPIIETSLHFATQTLPNRTANPRYIYRGLIQKGIDHPTAVHLMTVLCATLGSIVSVIQLTDGITAWSLNAVILFSVGTITFPTVSRISKKERYGRKPYLWGIPIDNVSMNFALSKVRTAIVREEEQFIVVTLNALAARSARHEKRYRRIASEASLCLADGWGIIWALKLLGTSIQERITGIDFMEKICRIAAIEGWPVYLLGSRPENVKEAVKVLEERYPGLVISGSHSGYFSKEEEPEIIDNIRESGTKILFAGMGVPRQEIWLEEKLPEIGPVVGVGVGGSFDVISGKLKRAPEKVQRVGLEWLYRLIQEPWRFKRDLHLLSFIILVLLTKLGLISDTKEDTQ